ncbi:FAD:protein FMN transferase [Anaerolineales bacterium HSG6]|nr:FAD:protein FMN transferase [Anaerolineales bacterium HSG6]
MWHWNNHSFKSMNTQVQIRLFSQSDMADEILLDVQELFGSFEKRLSRFDTKSELSQLNISTQRASLVSPTLLNAIEIALWAAEATNGLYDPTILNNLEQAGYDRTFEQVATIYAQSTRDYEPISPIKNIQRQSFSFREVSFNRTNRKIHKPVGLRFDLGGMGKGWTVDRAADQLQGVGPFMVNAGGDIFAYHSPPGEKGWQVNLIHPFKPEKFYARLHLHHQALATSTIAKRRWQKNGQVMHHLIDPRTKKPAKTDAISVSVVAERTVLAEIYAKVALILGAKRGLAYLERLPGVDGMIFTDDSQLLYTAGFGLLLDQLESTGFSKN